MSSENVDVVKQGFEAFGRGDLDAVAETFDEQVEWWTSEEIPNGGTIKGRDAVIQSFAAIGDDWDEFTLEPEQFLDAGDWVVVRGKARLKAKASGQTIEERFAHVVEIRDGKTVRGEFHSDSAKEYKALNA
jgi:ketosteroid isomerase-like protein